MKVQALRCRRPDREVPALVCGYPLPCPWHTVTIDLCGPVPLVTMPVTARKRLIKQLSRIAEALRKEGR